MHNKELFPNKTGGFGCKSMGYDFTYAIADFNTASTQVIWMLNFSQAMNTHERVRIYVDRPRNSSGRRMAWCHKQLSYNNCTPLWGWQCAPWQ
jgi:hypothetical protein